jgi:hypothetical protein
MLAMVAGDLVGCHSTDTATLYAEAIAVDGCGFHRDRGARLIEAFIQSPGAVVLSIPRAVDTILGPIVSVVLAAV